MQLFARTATLLLITCWAVSATAQPLRPRIGFGLTTTVTTDTENPVGLGLHVRGSLPVNPDLSFAVGAGVTGFIFGGQDDAVYYITPQALAIVTLNALNPRSPYALLGVGGYLAVSAPENEQTESGPTLSAGMGWAISLQQASVYVEVTPSLVIAPKTSHLIMPLKLGIVL